MTQRLRACLLLLCAASAAPAANLDDARRLWLRGNYEEAQADYEALAKVAKVRSPATVGLSRALQSQGEYDKALAVVTAALKALPKDADLLARRAEVLYATGQWAEAEKAADAAVAADAKQFAARWVQLQVYRDTGELKKAEAAARWFVRAYNADEAKTAEQLLYAGLATCEYARWHQLTDEFDEVLNGVFKDALKKEPAFWPVEYHAGLLLLEKYNRGQALVALDKALKINPSASEALAAKGAAALMRFDVQDAEMFAERALKFNPKLPEALRLRADAHLATGAVEPALKELKQAQKVNPRDERTLARVAACHHLLEQKENLQAVEAEVAKHDPKPALFYFELGERLEERRRYAEAEKYYLLARKHRPNLPGPLCNLGMLYMRLGREEEAGPLLDKGFEADKFHVRVSNMRKVLKHLQKYQTLKTKHFLVRYDPATDAALARYMGEYLEDIYTDLSKKFAYKPAKPILIELFSNHEMFSGRTVALPDLHTIGACTGRVVALASPNGWWKANEVGKGKPTMKRYNWARVLRHEVVHVFNLEQTNFLVPHWLTEGLAVRQEGFPRPPLWNQLLLERVPDGKKLLNLDTIDLGFIRPADPLQWQQAYCQSELYVQYVEKKYGPAAVGKLLAAYGKGLDTRAALAEACGKVDKATFEKGYRAYLDEVVKGLRGGRAAEKPRTLAQLREAYKKDPADNAVAAELALRVLPRSRVEARKLAKEVLDRKGTHPVALYVMAQLARLGGDADEERRLLEKGLDKADPEPRVLKALAKIYYDAGSFDKAAEVGELGRKAEPQEREWLLQLARVYAQKGDKDKQVDVLKALVRTDADDFDRRLRLAKLLLEKGTNDQAERYARQALEVDIKSAEARDTLYKALRGQKKDAELARVKGLLEGKGAGK